MVPESEAKLIEDVLLAVQRLSFNRDPYECDDDCDCDYCEVVRAYERLSSARAERLRKALEPNYTE